MILFHSITCYVFNGFIDLTNARINIHDSDSKKEKKESIEKKIVSSFRESTIGKNEIGSIQLLSIVLY